MCSYKALNTQLCLIEPLIPKPHQKFLCARSIVNNTTQGTVCRVLNPTDQVLWLSRRQPLDSIEPIDSKHIHESLVSQPEMKSSQTQITAFTPPVIIGTTPTHASSPLDEIGLKYHSDTLSDDENRALKKLL